MLDVLGLPFVQRGIAEILLLSVGAGLLGTWIVVRGLAFYSHAVGTAAFPGLVLADGLGFAAPIGAFAVALLFAAGAGRLADARRRGYDVVTALLLVGALALGAILASDVFHSGGEVETLLFGSLLALDTGDLVLAGATSALALAATFALGHIWLASGFDAEGMRALGVSSRVPDFLLFALIALATVAALSAVGALLVGAVFVVPAATVRLWTRRMVPWQVGTVALAAVEGVVGLWISVEVDAPPGAAIALLAGAVFAVAAVARALAARRARNVAVALGAAALALLVAGCGYSGASGGRPVVLATTTQIGDWARAVGGGAVEVHQILQPNTDPHEYEPRPSDVEAAADAKLVLLNGDRLDAWAGKVVSESGTKARVVDLGSSVPVRLPGETGGPEASRHDPHWWHDAVDARAAVARIRDAFIRIDPRRRNRFTRDAAAYVARLRALDADIRACMNGIPASQRRLVTDHDAFGYFARRYGIDVVGAVIPSQVTQAQASAGDVARLEGLIRRKGVHAVFPESSISPKLAQAIARDTGASSHDTLYGDTLGPKGSQGATYLGMEAANARAMARGFTGRPDACASVRA
ncbi:MAG TPA: zinc ABC transporter substrate-binding protein [Solirubrobacteraceae bacterium]|nr:zinc ABC transporter substrate-binding protein [Solirubrobacteraceae bacterium]